MPTPVPSALIDALDVLRCPQCRDALEPVDHSLRCPQEHTFDVARAGYVSLLSGGGAISGDDDAMARARERFLASGAYEPLRAGIAEIAGDTVPSLGGPADPAPTILDAGCGPGYYLAGLLDRFPHARGIGFDTSSRSLRFAARAHERAAVHSGDVFAPLPLADSSVDALLDVFSPRNPAEFARVLRPEGRLIVARPAAEHLAELRDLVPGMVAVDPRKEERLHTALDPHFTVVQQRTVRYQLSVAGDRARDLVAMTPSARHVDAAALFPDPTGPGGHEAPEPFPVTLSVLVSSHRRR